MNTELHPCGDRELWVIKGDDWSIPIIASPFKANDGVEYWVITPSVHMLKEPMEKLNATFAASNLSKDNIILVTYSELQRLAAKARGITPEFYYSWPSVEVKPKAELSEPIYANDEDLKDVIPKDAERFLKYVAEKTGALPYQQLKLVWQAFHRCGINYLLNDRRPINFGFVSITALPFRANWKSLLYQMHPNCKPWFDLSPYNRDERLASSGFEKDIWNTILIGINPNKKYFHWTLECEPSKEWIKESQSFELYQRTYKGAGGYARYYKTTVKKLRDQIVSIFGQWLKETAHPCATVGNSNNGDEVLIPAVGSGKVRGQVPERGMEDIVVWNGAKQLSCPEQVIPPENGIVSKVPNIPKQIEDVRDNGGDGMRLLPADQKPIDV